MSNFPNILIVSESPFTLENGFGITMLNLFEDWPRSNLAILHTRKFKNRVKNRCIKERYLNFASQNKKSIIPFFLGFLPSRGNKYSKKWIKRFLGTWEIDVIYSFICCPMTLQYTRWLKTTLNKPLVIHFADHFKYLEQNLGLTKAFLESCKQVFCISELMRLEYQYLFGIESIVLHNGANEEYFQKRVREHTPINRKQFKIVYLGTLHRDSHFDAVEDIIVVLKNLNIQLNFEVIFEIYGSEWTKQETTCLNRSKHVFFKGSVSKEKGVKVLKEADLLFIPMTFSPTTQEFYRFSFPTKLPEYMATGVPILMYGPKISATIDYCLKNEIGVIVSDRSINRLEAQIINIINDYDYYLNDAQTGVYHAKQNISLKTMQERLKHALRQRE